MRGLRDFIVQIENPYSETFDIEGGAKLYANRKFSRERLTNRIVKVVSTPLLHPTNIKVGYELLIDATILYKQTYKGKEQHYTNLVDEDNMWFKISPQMIVLYRKNEAEKWKGYLDNILINPIKEQRENKNGLLMPPTKNKHRNDRVEMSYANDKLLDYGVENGDEVIINEIGGVKFWLEGKEYWWMRSKDIIGVLKKNSLDKIISFTKTTKNNGAYNTPKLNISLIDEVGQYPFPNKKGNFVWSNKEKTEVEFVKNE